MLIFYPESSVNSAERNFHPESFALFIFSITLFLWLWNFGLFWIGSMYFIYLPSSAYQIIGFACPIHPIDQRTEPGLILLGKEHSHPMGEWGLLLIHTLSQSSACFTFLCLSCVFLLGSALFRSWRRPPQTLASRSQPSSRPISHGALHSTITEHPMTDVWNLLQNPASLQPTHHFVFLYLFWSLAVLTLFFSSAMPHQFSYFICVLEQSCDWV